MLDPSTRDDLAIDKKGQFAAGTALRAVGGEFGSQLVPAGGQHAAGADRILAIPQTVVVKNWRAVREIQRKAAKPPALGQDNALGTGRGHVQYGADREGMPDR